MKIKNKTTFDSIGNHCGFEISQEDEVKTILLLLARIEYENYLEIKGKCNSPNLVLDECRKFSLTSVNCKAA
jgi:hypothetical protein